MIDEASLRRPEFDPNSVGVDFNGTTLFLPKPVFRNRPVLKAGKIDGMRKTLATDDPKFAAAIKAVEDTSTYGAIIELAALLIGRNYVIDDETLGDLLTYDPADDSDDAWPSKVIAVAKGRSEDFPRPDTSASR